MQQKLALDQRLIGQHCKINRMAGVYASTSMIQRPAAYPSNSFLLRAVVGFMMEVAYMYGQGNVDGALQWGRLLVALWQWGRGQLYLCNSAAIALLL